MNKYFLLTILDGITFHNYSAICCELLFLNIEYNFELQIWSLVYNRYKCDSVKTKYILLNILFF